MADGQHLGHFARPAGGQLGGAALPAFAGGVAEHADVAGGIGGRQGGGGGHGGAGGGRRAGAAGGEGNLEDIVLQALGTDAFEVARLRLGSGGGH